MKLQNRKINLIIAAVLVPFAVLYSQTSGYLVNDTLWVKVTLYDYHCDGSNPNFEAGSKGRKPGMVQDYLSEDLKPVFKADLCFNSRLDEWYRPSGSDSTVKFIYNPDARRYEWTGLVQSDVDSTGWQGPLWVDRPADSMANIVFYDSLPFLLADSAKGIYEFIRDNNLLDHEQFFWLDERGFGNELSKFIHNFSFAMELHSEAVYQGGEFFEFRGDDDAWVFINGLLVVDLGGVQNEVKSRIYLDSLFADSLGLKKGEKYTLDFFYTERLSTQSNCVIMTNMLTPINANNLLVTTNPVPPVSLSTESLADTLLEPGQSIHMYAHIFDNSGTFHPEYSDLVRWEYFDDQGVKFRTDTVSDNVVFTFPDINGCVTIVQTYYDPQNMNVISSNSVVICNKNSLSPPVQIIAVILDTNSNGQFDRIDLIFPDTITLKQNMPSVEDLVQSTTFVTASGEVIPIEPIAIHRIDSTTIHIILKESGDRIETGWKNGQITLTTVPVTADQFPAAVISIKDSAGPVVQKAVLYPGNSINDVDTLRVSFSEPVNCSKLTGTLPESAFVFIDKNTSSDIALDGAVFGGTCNSTYISEVIILVNGDFEISPFEDSIGFVSKSPYVVDKSGMLPPVNGRRAAIEMGAENVIELVPSSNPVVADRAINEKIRQAYADVIKEETFGMVVGLYSKIPLRVMRIGSLDAYGKADIYDATGNLVQAALPVISTGRSGTYGIYWNVRNRNKRMVGNGTYLIQVATTDINGKKLNQRLKIGVQR